MTAIPDEFLALADQIDAALAKWDEPWPFEEPGQVIRDVRVLIDGVRHWHNEYLAACGSLTKRVHQGAEAVRRERRLRAAMERIAAGVRLDGTYDLSREACGPARVLVMATVVIPGEQAMPLDQFEAYVAQAFRDGGVHPVRVNAEFIGEAS